MADIFISYSKADASKAEAVAHRLSADGWSIFRYEQSQPGGRFRTRIRRELDEAGCVVVLWSQAAVESDFVLAEAGSGHGHGKLVPVWLQKVDLPLPFGEYDTLDLGRWRGGADSSLLDRLTAGVSRVLEPATRAGLEEAAHASLASLHSPLLAAGKTLSRRELGHLSALFEHEVAEFKGRLEGAEPDSLFVAAVDAVARRGPRTVLRVAGEAGSGSELMVGCLYLYQLGRHASGPTSQPYPIWVNLRDYDGLPAPEARLQRHLNRIRRFVEDHPSETPLLFAAGFDCYTHHRTALHELLADHTGGFRRIVAIDKGVHCNGFSEPASGPIPGRASRAIRLAGLEAGTPAASRFIKGFASLTHNGVTATDLERVAAVCNFSKVDIGTASMAYAMVALDDGNLNSGGAYFHRYLLDEYIPDCPLPAGADALARAAEYAYEYVVNGVAPPAAEQGCAAWQMVHRGEDLGRFLVAYRIAESAMRSRPTDADWEVLRRPLIQQTMYLARDLVNASKGSKTSFVKRAEVLFKTPDPDAVANMSFLLGRLEGEEARQDARRLLRRSRDVYLDQLAGLDIPGVTDKRISGLLFSLRTLYVSMIYLGDRKASDDYIGLMIDDPRWNRINRGFHLEYYGDIPIMPPDALRPGKASPFPRTYRRLTAKITSPHRQASFDLDVFTLYSLAQSCHLDGILEEPIRKKLVRLAPKLAKEVRSDRLKLYLGVMRRHLGYESLGTGCVAEELFRVKQVLRTGWVKRKVDRPESVADHMYGAFLLAFCYLPLQDEDEGYDRDRILKLLLVHDLAESETGDIVRKSRAQQRAESRWFAEATTLSTYAELAGVGELGDLWREYEGSNINARIAKDFDRLDQLTQLYIYRSQIRDFATWRAELLGSIETEQGKRVLEALTAHFDT